MRTVHRTLSKEHSVYIPHSADKGDCLYCKDGVLERDSRVEEEFCVKEGYSCDTCGCKYIESVIVLPTICGPSARYFVKVVDDWYSRKAVG